VVEYLFSGVLSLLSSILFPTGLLRTLPYFSPTISVSTSSILLIVYCSICCLIHHRRGLAYRRAKIVVGLVYLSMLRPLYHNSAEGLRAIFTFCTVLPDKIIDQANSKTPRLAAT